MKPNEARIAAKERGEKLFEGAPCKHGHGTTRYVSTGSCVTCSRESSLVAIRKRREKPVQEPAVL